MRNRLLVVFLFLNGCAGSSSVPSPDGAALDIKTVDIQISNELGAQNDMQGQSDQQTPADLFNGDIKYDGSHCTTNADCNDGQSCTTDVCETAGCKITLIANNCLINNKCEAKGVANSTDPCMKCDPTQNLYFWSYVNDGSYCRIGGICIAKDTLHPTDSCQRCDPSKNGTAWSVRQCVYTIPALSTATSFSGPRSIVVDSNGKIFVTDFSNHQIKTDSNGQVVVHAGTGTAGCVDGPVASAKFNSPYGISINAIGELFVGDSESHVVRWVAGGQVGALAGSCQSATAGYTNGPFATAKFNTPRGVVVDDSIGAVYVADEKNHVIRKIQGGTVSTYAGTGVEGYTPSVTSSNLAQFKQPRGVAINGAGHVYVADTYNHVIRWIAGGQVGVFAGTGTSGYVDGPVGTNQPGKNAQFEAPMGVVIDDSIGIVYIADTYNNCIRKIQSGQVSTLTGKKTSGYLDGSLTSALFNKPRGIAVDSLGRIYVADSDNNRIRLVVP